MKKLWNISLFAFFLSLFSAGAVEKEKDGVSLNGEQTLVVELTMVTEGTLILFEDEKGVVFFKDSLLNKGNYYKALNLEIIPPGIYLLKLDKRFATKVWKIRKSKAGIEILGKSSAISFKPSFRVQKNIVDVFMSNPTESRIELLVEDKNGEVLVDLKDAKNNFKKTLDFSKVPPGIYYLTVSKGKENYREKVVIN